MMEKILFRGKDLRDNEWFYGNVVKELSTGRTFILDVDKVDKDTKFFELAVEVDSESIEQC